MYESNITKPTDSTALYFYSFDGFGIFGHCFSIYAKTLLLFLLLTRHLYTCSNLMQLSKCFVVIYRSNLFFCVHILSQFGLQPVSYIKKALGVQRLQLRQLSASQQHDKNISLT